MGFSKKKMSSFPVEISGAIQTLHPDDRNGFSSVINTYEPAAGLP